MFTIYNSDGHGRNVNEQNYPTIRSIYCDCVDDQVHYLLIFSDIVIILIRNKHKRLIHAITSLQLYEDYSHMSNLINHFTDCSWSTYTKDLERF
jgi:hypothetical protein